MRTEKEIRAWIAEIDADERMHYKAATIFENAPLALIQLHGAATKAALEWALGAKSDKYKRRARAAQENP